MSVMLQYVASSGNVYNLKSDGIRSVEANYHAWGWVVNGTQLQFGKRVSSFQREAAVYDTTLIFYGSHDYRKGLIDALHEDFELDVRNMTPGRIIWGDYYIDCYISSSSTEPNENLLWTNNKISFYCPYPFWIKEETKTFLPQEAPVGQTYLDYPFDYTYDYYFGVSGIAIWQTGFPFSSDFRLTIYGTANNPRILINGYPYQVNTDLGASEYLIIDSKNNTVSKYTSSGQMVDIFDYRDKTKSVFNPIPSGALRFNWSGAFGFDLTLYEERSEPRS